MGELIDALERGWDGPRPAPAPRFGGADEPFRPGEPLLGFYSLDDVIHWPPYRLSPDGSDFGEPPEIEGEPPPWGIISGEELLQQLYVAFPVRDGVSILGGKLALRASPDVHRAVQTHLDGLRRRGRLFNALFQRTGPSAAAALPLLERLAGHPASPAWLRSACQHAVDELRGN